MLKASAHVYMYTHTHTHILGPVTCHFSRVKVGTLQQDYTHYHTTQYMYTKRGLYACLIFRDDVIISIKIGSYSKGDLILWFFH